MEQRRPPNGLTRRRRRLSDAETRDRMLRFAIDMISREGLTVSLEHISFEAVIRSADVSRSSAYRHWQYKDQFFGDVVKELARSSSSPIVRDEISLIKQVLAEHEDQLDSPPDRHAVMIELIRRLALLDLRAALASPAWRTYHVLRATVSSLADEDLRGQVQTALAESEKERLSSIADAWRTLTGMFGYRLRPELNASFETLASVVGIAMHGLVITELAAPDVAEQQIVARPFGAPSERPWSLAALSIAGVAMTFLEPDPQADREGQDLASLRQAIDDWASNRR
jgi:AcrR family transcriptional regulator